MVRYLIYALPKIHIIHARAPIHPEMAFQHFDPFRGQKSRRMHAVGDVGHRIFCGFDFRPHVTANRCRYLAMDARHAIAETRAAYRQGGHIEIRAVLGMSQPQKFLAAQCELWVIMLEIGLHHAFVEMVMPRRNRRMRGENRIDRHIFMCRREVQALVGNLLADPFQDQERRVAFIDMPHGRTQSQHLQCTHSANTQHDFLLDTHHLVAAI